MYQTPGFRVGYHTPSIWRADTNPGNIQNQEPRPSVDLTADGFFSAQPRAQQAWPTYDPLSLECPGPGAQDDFEMQLDTYFDDTIPATVTRALPPFPPARRPSGVEQPRATASTSTAPPSPPCDADFAFYGDQRDYLFLKDKDAGAYSNEPVLVRSRFEPSVPTVNEGVGRRSVRGTRSELNSKQGTVNDDTASASRGSPKKSSAKSRKAVDPGESSTKTRRRKDAPSMK